MLNAKTMIVAVVITLVVVFLYMTFYQRYSKFNTSPVAICPTAPNACTSYNIHNEHSDRLAAAKSMDHIYRDINKLMEHLGNRYLRVETVGGQVDPIKENRIDVIPYSDAYLRGVGSEYMSARVKQLFERFQRDQIYEISPKNTAGLTSYTENKGDQLVLCLREKFPRNGEYQLHDHNTMMFVVCHELTHIMNDEWGHEEEFWELFKVVLENAVEIGIYTPVDYRNNPINYCGLVLNYSPLYDLQEDMESVPHWDFRKV